jgi:drug/metabolite transporter (DMT)-like permease
MLLVVVCWASNIIAGKEALTGFTPLALAQLRVLGAGVMFAVGFLATGGARRLKLTPRSWLLMLALAANGAALGQFTFIYGMALSTVAHTGLMVALGPVMVLVLAVLLRLEALTAWKFAGMMIAFAGVGILTADQAVPRTLGYGAGQGNGGQWLGDLILLASAVVFAVYTILVKEVANRYDALTLNTMTFAPGAILMVPFCAHAVAETRWGCATWEAWWGLTFLIVFGTVISYLLYAYVLTELAASRVAAFNYLQPVIASTLGIWVLSERLTPKVLAGGALILAGVYLTERERGEENEANCHHSG